MRKLVGAPDCFAKATQAKGGRPFVLRDPQATLEVYPPSAGWHPANPHLVERASRPRGRAYAFSAAGLLR